MDIDGNDYYVLGALFKAGFRPKIVAVEHNSAFGPERSVTIPYKEDFRYSAVHPSGLYFGVSIAAWRVFFLRHDYRFVTVDQSGVNAFFIRPDAFSAPFVSGLRGATFRENFAQRRRFGTGWSHQWQRIADMDFVSVE